ncbi:hypothetical protein XU18_5153 [Perkinsela sp. CCAP 1560/4]|nr:hypothetical protein XU18_5153 [Perkinsela sp. CCAP 1560/4]|eukprot:KNH01785.1 hypothetical protein XU18_5153 [Perkinsela sp. CCAP 1560/4]
MAVTDSLLKVEITPESLPPERLLAILLQIGKFDESHKKRAQKALRTILQDPSVHPSDLEWKIEHAIKSVRQRFIRDTGVIDEIEALKNQKRKEKLRKQHDLSKKISRFLDEEAESGEETDTSASEGEAVFESNPKRAKKELSLDETLNLLD